MRIMFDEIRNNKIKSYFLVAMFIVLIGVLGAVGGLIYGNIYFGLILALIIGLVYSLISYFSGDRMILSMSGAKPVTKKEYPYLYHTIEAVAIAADIPTPKAYVIEDKALNAFATGRDPQHAAVAVTTGLIERLDRQELEGVIAHEISHIKNYDIRMMMLVTVLIGIVVLLSDFLLRTFLFAPRGEKKEGGSATMILIVVGLALAILAPLIAKLIQLAISRKREYMADANGALLTRYPPGLASALKKISQDSVQIKAANKASAHLYISSPFKKKKGFFKGLFATHPPIDDRIKRLEQM